MKVYYNEFDPYAAQWLRNLIVAGYLPSGFVDERSITDVETDDLIGYTQCHFFAGIGGWSLAARLAGWPDDREIWTGSPPCQPFSVAGKQRAQADDRHLWPHLFRLLSARRPAVFMGEQVAAAVGKDWLDGVFTDLESIGYSCGASVIPACAVNAPHRRDRLWIVSHGSCIGGKAGLSGSIPWQERQSRIADNGCRESAMADADERGCAQGLGDDTTAGHGHTVTTTGSTSAWAANGWIIGHDGKARRVEPSICLLANGVPARVGKLRAYGNAIVPQVAAEVIGAYLAAELEGILT